MGGGITYPAYPAINLGASIDLSSNGTIIAISSKFGLLIYTWNGSNWSQLGQILEHHKENSANSVKISNNGQFVVSNYNNTSVKMYQLNGTTWMETGTAINNFGSVVALNGDGSIVAIGNPNFDSGGVVNRGYVNVHVLNYGRYNDVAWNGSVYGLLLVNHQIQ